MPTFLAASTPPRATSHHCTGDHVGLEVVTERALGVRFGNHRDPVPGHLDEQVVQLMAVDRPLLTRGQAYLPHPDPVVLEEQAGADRTELALPGHDAASSTPAPRRQNRTA